MASDIHLVGGCFVALPSVAAILDVRDVTSRCEPAADRFVERLPRDGRASRSKLPPVIRPVGIYVFDDGTHWSQRGREEFS